MRHLIPLACLALLTAATGAKAATYNLVDSTGKVAGELETNSSVIFPVGGQAVSVPVYTTGFENRPPIFYYTEDNCASQKLIQASGLVNYGYVYKNALYFGNTEASTIVFKSRQYFDLAQNKYTCKNDMFGFPIHVAPVRVMPVSVLELTPPFTAKLK